MGVRSVSELDLAGACSGTTTPSPAAWEDEVLYFLLLDRFARGVEEGYPTPPDLTPGELIPRFVAADAGNAVTDEESAARWREAGRGWVGGTLAGVRSKLGYLSRLGVTALWISPVLKQARTPQGWAANYHGYATQDFLSVDEHFGTAEDLRTLVREAHEHGLRVILDVVLNHAGDVFAYEEPSPRWDGSPRAVAGWLDGDRGLVPFTPEAAAAAWPDGAVFPSELHPPHTFTRRGAISDWDNHPEYLEGDFCALKDIDHGSGPVDAFRPSAALEALIRAYCWWIATADLDGFRVDTVKHMDPGAVRHLATVVHEFAQSIGKDRFYLIGEITGPREHAVHTMELTGLDAALGLADVQYQLEAAAKGWTDPARYFELFRNSALLGKDSHTWLRHTVVTTLNDHDMVRQGGDKARFCADPEGPALALAALTLNVLTLGIPCIYYGSEQCLDGRGGGAEADRYLREAMFGGEYGPFRSRGRHVFDEQHPVYRELAKVLALRGRERALRRGRQYLREISGDGRDFGFPTALGGDRVLSVVAWSRILADRELICAVNTDPAGSRAAWVTVDAGLHRLGDTLECLYRSDGGTSPSPPVVEGNGKAVRVELPPGGVAVYGPHSGAPGR
ncbi:MAG: alpha-amylase [Actinomycetales bacterium]|nr:alpha-amylase [Actinomycetales bacterium]